MQTTIRNHQLEISIQHKGAELSSIKNSAGREFLWQADANFWPRHAPVLFPIVGRLKDNKYTHNRSTYSLPQHGFARDKMFYKKSVSDDFVVFYLNSDVETQLHYPFEFELMISYALIKNRLIVEYKVTNFGMEVMPFSIGAHPGFCCPIDADEKFEDYTLKFEKAENLKRKLLVDGLFTGEEMPFLTNDSEVKLSKALFEKDAIVVQNFQSNFLSLSSAKHTVKVGIAGFPYLGIWTKPGAPFVCIEPWFGLSDKVAASGNLNEKEGIQILDPQKEFSCSYTLEFS